MKRLVESWIRAERELHGNDLTDAIRLLNDARGFSITRSRVSEWRRGIYVPSQLILSAILYRTLAWALREAGIAVTPQQLSVLQSMFWRRFENNGKPFIDLL